ncbi:TetR/AcrR family transcriptional regulator [Paenibacillus sp.]|jgi:AcrR family transcriptional regulator|uniref:TetR/AcrR family transcriptional regulator n=1 Tax=Paenibacillus sp. TaxID=58172 RepID=UPI0028371056|nr:TetR/AcrR family transcriptional regulator [Paenibacillus sp.]MDR0267997.1 TetR/AcrR family transcriptional regulator [Paenibacillus sp.]
MDQKQITSDKEKNKDVKNQILQSAKKLFSKNGYNGTTVRQICDEANVSLALISYHFGGKENVFFEIFAPFRLSFMNSEFDLSDPEQDLIRFCRMFVMYRYEEKELFNILQQELLLKSPRIEMLKDVFLQAWEQLRIILLACKERGIIDNPPVDMAVNFVMGTLMFSLNNPFLNPSNVNHTSEEAADLAVNYILNGLQISST